MKIFKNNWLQIASSHFAGMFALEGNLHPCPGFERGHPLRTPLLSWMRILTLHYGVVVYGRGGWKPFFSIWQQHRSARGYKQTVIETAHKESNWIHGTQTGVHCWKIYIAITIVLCTYPKSGKSTLLSLLYCAHTSNVRKVYLAITFVLCADIQYHENLHCYQFYIVHRHQCQESLHCYHLEISFFIFSLLSFSISVILIVCLGLRVRHPLHMPLLSCPE